jgi:hypothetical protein
MFFYARYPTPEKMINLFRVDENRIEQCFAAHIVEVVNNIEQDC